MKKWSILFIVMVLVGSLTGCGEKEAPEEAPQVTIEIPRDMLNNQSDEDIRTNAENENIKVTIKDDDTVVYKMTEEKQQELLLSYKNNFEELLQKDIDQGKLLGVVDVSYDENMTEFRIIVNSAVFNQPISDQELGWFYSTGTGCQLFAGVPEESIDVKLVIVDQDSQEEIQHYSMRESFFDQEYQADTAD